MLKKLVVSVMLFSCSYMAHADIQAHNLNVIKGCRAFPSGDVQVVGLSETDNQERAVIFSKAIYGEKVLDRYLSLCLASSASGSKLRIDYLECSGTTCVSTGNTSLNMLK